MLIKLVKWNAISAGEASILFSLFFLSGVQLTFLGLLGEYVYNVFTNFGAVKRVIYNLDEITVDKNVKNVSADYMKTKNFIDKLNYCVEDFNENSNLYKVLYNYKKNFVTLNKWVYLEENNYPTLIK